MRVLLVGAGTVGEAVPGTGRQAGDDQLEKADRTDKVRVKGVEVAPRDVLAAITPDPARLGDRMTGRAIVGT